MSSSCTGSLTKVLFGFAAGWQPEDWTASDDKVRGGMSQSYLTIEDGCATFNGTLDTKTLGGAGFASQRTTGDDRKWDLSDFDGIEIVFDADKCDDKRYTFILKDTILPKSADGREQSTISWEYDFTCDDEEVRQLTTSVRSIAISWNAFKPTYRGKAVAETTPLAKANIKRISIMMRSFFGSQSGNFSFQIIAIQCFAAQAQPVTASRSESYSSDIEDLKAGRSNDQTKQGFWSRLLCWSPR